MVIGRDTKSTMALSLPVLAKNGSVSAYVAGKNGSVSTAVPVLNELVLASATVSIIETPRTRENASNTVSKPASDTIDAPATSSLDRDLTIYNHIGI